MIRPRLIKWLAPFCVLECVGAATSPSSPAPKFGAAIVDGGEGLGSGEGSTCVDLTVDPSHRRPQSPYCRRDESCWPTAAEVDALRQKLDPAAKRTLTWDGPGSPRPAPAVLGLELMLEHQLAKLGVLHVDPARSQPLAGAGKNKAVMDAVVVADPSSKCGSAKSYVEAALLGRAGQPACAASLRNNPLPDPLLASNEQDLLKAAFVVWPLTTNHVQEAVLFATRHRLCVAVIGTGHDWANRHSCPDGVYIRTSLLNSHSFDPSLDNGGGAMEFGAGLTFEQAQFYAANHGRFIASGWCPTVGIAGWSLSGGHGPFAPSKGLGVDNLVQAEVVLANGSAVTANSTHHPELWKAMRGGGGGAWGVVTKMTLRAHPIEDGGFTMATASFQGDGCDHAVLNKTVEAIYGQLGWAMSVDSSLGGYALTSTSPGFNLFNKCRATWSIFLIYVWSGDNGQAVWDELADKTDGLAGKFTKKTYGTWWEAVRATDEFKPFKGLPLLDTLEVDAIGDDALTTMNLMKGGAGPSVLVPLEKLEGGDVASALKDQLVSSLTSHQFSALQIFQDLTGNKGSEHLQKGNDTSISHGLRTAALHLVFAGAGGNSGDADSAFCKLGANAYQAEASFGAGSGRFGMKLQKVAQACGGGRWKKTFWGEKLYAELNDLKSRLDPNKTFWCRYCVGDNTSLA